MRDWRYVYIVEMLNDAWEPPVWEPTVGCALKREDARRELAQWRKDNPSDRFRLAMYKLAKVVR